jgi:adenylate cyclase
MATQKTSLCVLFADIVGSTGLYEALGDEEGRRIVLASVDLMKDVVERFGGTVIERVGDEVLASFPDAVSAGRGSCQLHRAFEAATDDLSTRVAVRVGFHYGPFLIENGRVFGDTIHVARRIASQAKAQQTLISRQTKERIPISDSIVTRFVDRIHLKGKAEAFELFEIIWDEGAATVESGDCRVGARDEGPMRVLVLECGEQTVELRGTRTTVTLGRDARADIVINHTNVSRSHARIEFRKGKFLFVDQSTNGSRVIEVGGKESFLRRDECILNCEGTIVLGSEGPGSGSASLHYRLVAEESG